MRSINKYQHLKLLKNLRMSKNVYKIHRQNWKFVDTFSNEFLICFNWFNELICFSVLFFQFNPSQRNVAFDLKTGHFFFELQIKYLVSLWNAILGWSGLSLAAAKVLFFKKVLFFYRKLSMYYLLFKFASVVLFANIFMNLSIYHTCVHIPQKAIK